MTTASRALDEIYAELARAPLGPQPLRDILPARLRTVLGTDVVGMYRVETFGDRLRCAWARFSGVESIERPYIRQLDTSTSWAALDWRRPPVVQRDRLIYLPSPKHLIDLTPRGARALGLSWAKYQQLLREGMMAMHSLHARFGVDDHRQYRAIVCDGPIALAWVGLTHQTTVPRAARRGLARLLPVIRNRIILEYRLEMGDVLVASLEQLLERYAGAALIRDRRGVLVHANAAAQVRIETRTLEPIDPRVFARVSLGNHRGEILLERLNLDNPDCARAAVRWGLTARQRQVLELLIAGHTNRVIATVLSVTEATVEFHVTRIMDRAGVESRAGLASETWRQSRIGWNINTVKR